jgi:hypothetical protein
MSCIIFMEKENEKCPKQLADLGLPHPKFPTRCYQNCARADWTHHCPAEIMEHTGTIYFPGILWSWLVSYRTVTFVAITVWLSLSKSLISEYLSSHSRVYTTFKISSSVNTCGLLLVAIFTHPCAASSHVTGYLRASKFGHIILHFLLYVLDCVRMQPENWMMVHYVPKRWLFVPVKFEWRKQPVHSSFLL